jgi:hypothetical protein
MTTKQRRVCRDRNGKSVIPSLRVPYQVGQDVWVTEASTTITITDTPPPGIELTPLAPGTTLEPRFTGALRKDLAE